MDGRVVTNESIKLHPLAFYLDGLRYYLQLCLRNARAILLRTFSTGLASPYLVVSFLFLAVYARGRAGEKCRQ